MVIDDCYMWRDFASWLPSLHFGVFCLGMIPSAHQSRPSSPSDSSGWMGDTPDWSMAIDNIIKLFADLPNYPPLLAGHYLLSQRRLNSPQSLPCVKYLNSR